VRQAPGFVGLPPTEELLAFFPDAARTMLPGEGIERKIERARYRAGLDIVERQRCELRAAFDFAIRDPGSVVVHTGRRLYSFLIPSSFLLRAVAWGLYPDGPLAAGSYSLVKIIVVLTELGLMLGALLFFAARRNEPIAEWALLFGGFYMTLHALSAASSRYRLPLMAFAIVLSALLLARPRWAPAALRGTILAAAAVLLLGIALHYVTIVLP
jgi:hypothetical protein